MRRVDEATGNNKVIIRVCPPSSILSDNHHDIEDCVDRRSRSDSFSTLNTLANSLGIGETVVDANQTLVPISQNPEPLCCVECTSKEIHLKEPPNEHFKQGKEKITTFTFDGVFPSSSLSSIPSQLEEKVLIEQQDQLDIYKGGFVVAAVENVIKSVGQDSKQPFNEVIISYGPTGSGKTYTMFGSGLCPGLLPRAFSDLFFKLEAAGDKYIVELSVVEVYNSLFIDLLESSKQKKAQLSATTTSVKQNLAIERSNRLARTSSSSYVSKLFASNNLESSPASEGAAGSPNSNAETIQSLFCPTRASSAPSSPDDEQMRSLAGRKSFGATKTVAKPMKKTTFNSSVYATPNNSKTNAKKTSPATAGPHGKGFTGESKEICSRLRVYSATEAMELVRNSRRRRKTAKRTCAGGNLDMSASTTHKTYDSSRGHLICTLHVKTEHGSGKLMFIDLAGTHSGTSSMESHHINLSLLTLGEVLQSLSFNTDAAVRKSQQLQKPQPSVRRQSFSNVPSNAFQSSPTAKAVVTTRVPYMDSKLTQLLADHSHIVLVAHVQPEQAYYSNTLRILNYASKGRPLLRPPTVQFSRRRTVAGGEGKSMIQWPPKSAPPDTLAKSESQDQPPSVLLEENKSLKQQLSFLQNQVIMLSKFPPRGRKSDCFSETSSAVSSPVDINQ
eukprot:gene31580-42110_t